MTGVLPAVHPHLARWSADCGAGILGPILEAVDDVGTPPIRSVLSAASQHAELARASAPSIHAYADRLAAAWSTPRPARYLAELSEAVSRLATDVHGTVQRVGSAIRTIENTQRILASAIERANTAVDWAPSYVAWGTPEAEARTAAARTLAAAAQASHAQLLAAISSLGGVLSADPGAALAAMTPPTAVPLPTAAHAGPGSAAGAAGLDFRPTMLGSAAAEIDRRARDRLAADLQGDSAWHQTFAVSILEALTVAEAAGGGAQLLVYDPDAFRGQGRVAIAVGDVSAADHVAILTPGIATSPTELAAAVPTAAALRTTAEQVATGESTAVVLWFGYDIPVSGGPNDTLTDP